MIVIRIRNSWRKEFIYGQGNYGDNNIAWRKEWSEWCSENCQGFWKLESNGSDGGCSTYVYFNLEGDAMAFKLVWGGM